jgi:fructose-1,6-bisphosphatase/inositol monophosphatase family enzyme
MVNAQRLHVFEGLLMISRRDVAAGICILQEAGGLITTANPPEDFANAPIRDARLGSRLYLAVR